MRIGIVADDLTGAADAVAPFARIGFSAAVSLAIRRGLVDGKVDALALNAATRDSIRPQLGGIKIRRATRRLLECGAEIIYKKIDSTLRGFLRQELDAMQKELPGRLVVICPAFPANGRTVEQGVMFAHGRPHGSVRAAFEYAQNEMATELPLETLRQGADYLTEALGHLTAAGKCVLFCDASEQGDLEILAEVILRQPERVLSVGSAGLSTALAAQMLPETQTHKDTWSAAPFTAGNVLVVVGSRHAASRRQAEVLARKSGCPPLILDNQMTRGEYWKYTEKVAAQLLSQWEAGHRVALMMAPESERTATVARDLGAFFIWCLMERSKHNIKPPFASLIIVGGETAGEIFNGMNAKQIRIAGETQPGVVMGHLHSHNVGSRLFDGLRVITKSGGFGDDETLARCVGLA